ncbi:AAA family ATPase [Halotalea alkalilenta]|uniref:Kinase n=1 Tax=Halotalea alkalilenta TaxID=376489 RepID=A0A172YBC9_9GAMM|nr:ATP-binding protein [Halotalea alkalilenta]ANF56422.1 hypothetical protein A5892_02200 [Halotalea alkalilenta]
MTQPSRQPLFEALHRHGVLDAERLTEADRLDCDQLIELCHQIAERMLAQRDRPKAVAEPPYQRLDQAMLASLERLCAHPATGAYAEELEQLGYWAVEAFARMHGALEKRRQLGLSVPVGEVVEGDVCLELVAVCCDILTLDGLPLANEVVDRYLEGCGDFEMMRLFDYAAVYYALRRAEEVVDQPLALRRYIETTIYIAEFRVPYLLLGVGVIGSGKSRFTQAAMRELAGIRVRSNVERQRLLDERAAAGLPVLGEYDPEITAETYARLAKITGALLEASYPVYIDATCLKREQRDLLRNEAQSRGLATLMVNFQADRATLEARISRRSNRRQERPEVAFKVLDEQLAQFEPFEEDERIHLIQLDTTARDANVTLVALIREHLRLS